jgi:hypothetical protein
MAEAIDEFLRHAPELPAHIVNESRHYKADLRKFWGITDETIHFKKQQSSQWCNMFDYINPDFKFMVFLWYADGKITEYAIVKASDIQRHLFQLKKHSVVLQTCIRFLKKFKPQLHVQHPLTKDQICEIATIVRDLKN